MKLNIYNCGGCGCNIGQKAEQTLHEMFDYDISFHYLDTSTSSHVDDVYIFASPDGQEGSGQFRKRLAKIVNDRMPKALDDGTIAPPAECNIVMYSTSGGSGSVIAPVLIRELLLRKANVISMAVAGFEGKRNVQNTAATLKTLAAMSGITKLPVVTTFFSNEVGIKEADKSVISHLVQICRIFNPANDKLDISDIQSFLQYNRVTDIDPGLAILTVCTDLEEHNAIAYPESVISILPAGMEPPKIKAEFVTYGFDNGTDPVAFIVDQYTVDEVVSYVDKQFDEFSNATRNRPAINHLDTGNSDGSGLIFD